MSFPKNEHGHRILYITGLNLMGTEDIVRLEADGFRISDYAKQCLLSTNPDSYDANHRLEEGRVYKVALISAREVKENRTTANSLAYGQSFGYGKPLAGIMPRIRESITDKQMEHVGIRYIVGFHDPIKDSGGHPHVLCFYRYDDGQWRYSDWDYPGSAWDDDGAFAFVVPQT